MSVRLRPTVRCTFDEDQGVLRLTLKEAMDEEPLTPNAQRQQVVVYALKVSNPDPIASFEPSAHDICG